MKTKVIFLTILTVLVFLFASCGGGGVENTPAAQNATKAFSIGNNSWDTLQEAVNSLKGKSADSKAVAYTIRLNGDVSDNGAEITGITSSVKIDFGSYTYTLKSGGIGIVIDNSGAIEIAGGKIKVAENGTLSHSAVIISSSEVKLTGTLLDATNASVNAIEITGGTFSIEGTTSITTKDDQITIAASGESKVTIQENANVVLTGGLKMEDKADVNLGNGVLNLTQEIEKGDEVVFTASTENIVPTENSGVDAGQITEALHNHTFSDKWQFTDEKHWREAICEHNVKADEGSHSWDDGIETIAPTHTEVGEITYTCKVCGNTKKEVIPADSAAHTFSSEWTSDEDYHWHASTCGHDVVSDKHTHIWNTEYKCETCGFDYFELVFTISEEGELKVKDAELLPSNLEIPASIKGIKVSTIGEYAFSGCGVLVSVSIPDSVTNIKHNAFRECVNLQTVELGDSVVMLGSHAFHGCSSLSSVNIPDSVSRIGDYTFYLCSSLESVTLGNGVTSLGIESFRECSNLSTIYLPHNLSRIEGGAFSLCENLMQIIFDGTISEWNQIEKQQNWNLNDSNSLLVVCSDHKEHSWPDVWTVRTEATEVSEGLEYMVCQNGCGLEKTRVIPVLSHVHTYSANWTADEEYHWHASTCGHDVISAKTNHSWNDGAITKEPTHTDEGVKTFTCTVCGKTKTEKVSALNDNHTFSAEWAADDDYHWHPATCGHEIVSDKSNHSWNDGVVTKEATHTEAGEKTYTCSVCGKTKIEIIPAIINAHTFSDEWEYDATYHWHPATCGHSGPVSGKAGHNLDEDGKCTVCSFDVIESLFYISELGEISVKEGCVSRLPKELVIPSKIFGMEVKGIKIFPICDVTSITIPSSVTSIGSGAFEECTNLTSITISNSVTSIGNRAFSGCTGLKSIVIPNSVTSIGDYAFSGCTGLKSVVIPNSVTSIGDHAFSSCTGLTSITIPNSVTIIGHLAFSDCTSLNDVYISSLDSWCKITFDGTYGSNPLYYAYNLYVNGELFSGEITSDVTIINENAFTRFKGLTSVVIPNSVTSIGECAFYDCFELTNITISDSVTSIGRYAFYGCRSLSSIIIPDSVTELEPYVFSACKGLTSVVIPDSITSIGQGAFSGCYQLTNVIIPDSVTIIGSHAFRDCSNLINITIGNSVTKIEEYAFSGCIDLKNVYISDISTWLNIEFEVSSDPNFNKPYSNPMFYAKHLHLIGDYSSGHVEIPSGVTTIPDLAFKGCTELVSITIPDSVTSIGSSAFYDCTSLTDVYVSDFSSWFNISFDSNPMAYAEHLYVDGKMIEGSFEIPSDVSRIPYGTFKNSINLTNIIIPDSVSYIEDKAFYGCIGLTDITIPDSVKGIGFDAFYGCNPTVFNNNSSVDVNYSFSKEVYTMLGSPSELIVSNIYSSVELHDCTELTEITIPNTVKRIGYKAFYGCTGLTNINIPNSVTIIDGEAFYGCTGLTSITIPDSVTEIGKLAFHGCNPVEFYNYSSVVITDSFGNDVYTMIGSPSELTISNLYSYISMWAFRNCAELTSVIIPNSVISIGINSFRDCTGLTSITIPDSVTSIERSAFEGCVGLSEIEIPSSVSSIASYAFSGCKNLVDIYYSGTKNDWELINKDSGWKPNAYAVIHCSDGDV